MTESETNAKQPTTGDRDLAVAQRLRAELQEAEKELAYWERQLDQKPEFGLGKGSTGADLWEMAMLRSEQVAARIEALQEALERLSAGSKAAGAGYGFCERCGAAIDPERLEILPETTLCVNCARLASAAARSGAAARAYATKPKEG